MKTFCTTVLVLLILHSGPVGSVKAASADPPALQISVYTTAGGVNRYLGTAEGREKALSVLQALRVSRLFVEGRRGDEYVDPETLRAVRDYFAARGIICSGGIATVPGRAFGARQNGEHGWMNWESEKTRRDISGFFSENAPLFEEIVVDDFYCTADTSPPSAAGRAGRSWSQYRRDLLVSLIEPLMVQPARAAHPSVRLIIKYPQWYDRFHLFGYDPPRMSPAFDQVWVGTEVRNPATQRMGFVQPTEGYMNFRWLQSIAGEKVRGAWFDHIESTAWNFVDQAYQSVLAGARELTLFHLGDILEGHPGDALLREKLPELVDLAGKLRGRKPAGMPYYKPPGGDAAEDMYLMDYLGMIGLPILPVSSYPAKARVAFLGVQAAADPSLLANMRRHLKAGAALVLTPALVRRLGAEGMRLAGVEVGPQSAPGSTTDLGVSGARLTLTVPLEYDTGVKALGCRVLIETKGVPLFMGVRRGRGAVHVLNVRTFDEQDFRDTGELLLAPKERGLAFIPERAASEIRRPLLEALGVHLEAPSGVALYMNDRGGCLYSFLDQPAKVSLGGRAFELAAHGLHCW